jgi:hypothetical protein
MTRSPRPPVVTVLRFAEELAELCERHGVEAWFVPHASVRQIPLPDLPHLPKSMIRSGCFAVAFVPDRPQHRPVRPAEWYVRLGDIAELADTLEVEFVARVLQYTFDTPGPS